MSWPELGQLECDRVVFFSDAVFAIAITQLIVDLQVPEVAHVESGRQLRDALPQIGGFALSFAVIRLFWMGHHRLFRHIKGLNWSLVLLNLLFLGCIAFLPYPTARSARPAARCRRRSSMPPAPPPPGWPRLRVAVRDPHPRAGPPRHLARGAPLDAAADHPDPVVFLLSIPVAITRPALAKYLWLLVLVSGLALGRLEPADEEPAATDELGG